MEKELKEHLAYDELTGELVWTQSKGARKAGSIAGSKTKDGYVQLGFNKWVYKAHRIAWFLYYGVWPLKPLDHINRNRPTGLPKLSKVMYVLLGTTETNLIGIRTSGKQGTNDMTKFEVGKKYNYSRNSTVYPCIAIMSDGCAVLEDPVNYPIRVERVHEHYYKEYVEPLSGTGWVNVYQKGTFGDIHKTRKEADRTGPAVHRIACIEVKWTEGQGL